MYFCVKLNNGHCNAGKLENVKDTIGVMDLGGGSTQVTFVPREAVSH